jgi:diaminopimelate decarboxylase
MSFLPEVYSTNSTFEAGTLSIAGIPAASLVREFGSPLYVVDEEDFMARATAWKSALDRHFGSAAGNVYYASKSFTCIEVAKWVMAAGIGIDVCTAGEMAVARAAGFPAELIEVHGNNKSVAEITAAIEMGVGAIIVDSFIELERIHSIAASLGKIQKILLRLTPGVDAHTHEFISTAHEDVKFGFSIASGAAWKAIEYAQGASAISLAGVHAHIGSQIFVTDGFELAATRLIALLAQFRDHYGVELSDLDLGGGYGIAYLPGEATMDPDAMMAKLAQVVSRECAAHELAAPRISIEPGRAIVGPTTTTLYTVGTTKSVELDGGTSRRYIAVDGGMSDNIRPALYGAEYTALLANRESTASVTSSRLVGKHCESGDILIREIDLASDIGPDDILAIPATGAYCRSMASNYNHVGRPAVVAVKQGQVRTILRREGEADLLALDVIEAARTIR